MGSPSSLVCAYARYKMQPAHVYDHFSVFFLHLLGLKLIGKDCLRYHRSLSISRVLRMDGMAYAQSGLQSN